jgi:hypothetical protein
VATDAHIAQLRPLQVQQQPADAGPVHLDAEEIAQWLALCTRQQVLAIAEADLHRAGLRVAEERRQVARRGVVVQAVFGPQFIQCALLAGGDAATADHE